MDIYIYIFQYNRFETYPKLDTPVPFDGGSSTVYRNLQNYQFLFRGIGQFKLMKFEALPKGGKNKESIGHFISSS